MSSLDINGTVLMIFIAALAVDLGATTFLIGAVALLSVLFLLAWRRSR